MPIYLNINNYLSFYRIFLVFKNPFYLIKILILKKIPEKVVVKTPIGNIDLYIRNYESLKTIFSIFCRQDYHVGSHTTHYLDIGANCGYAAMYFLCQNSKNTITCFEPDQENVVYLKKNLKFFGERSKIIIAGVGTMNDEVDLYLSNDGKYSSIIKKEGSKTIKIKLISIEEILKSKIDKKSLTIKIDVEGIEKDIIKNIDFIKFPNIKKIVVESTECSKLIQAPHKIKLVNGYIEHISIK